MADDPHKEENDGNLEQMQLEWQKDFFAQLDSVIPDSRQQITQEILQPIQKQVSDDPNTIGGAVADVIKHSKKFKSKKSIQKVPNAEQTLPQQTQQMSKQWKLQDKRKFLKGLMAYGLNFPMISEYIGTKTAKQVRQRYNRESKKNKAEIDEKLKYYDDNGHKKAKSMIHKKIKQIKLQNPSVNMIPSNGTSDSSIAIATGSNTNQILTPQQIIGNFCLQQINSLKSQPSNYSLGKSDSLNSANDFLEQKLLNIYNKVIDSNQN